MRSLVTTTTVDLITRRGLLMILNPRGETGVPFYNFAKSPG
jgi:hypothetical protein